MKKLKFIVEKTSGGYSAYADKYNIFTTGVDVVQLKHNIIEASNLHFDGSRAVTEADIHLSYSIASFFDAYPINAKQFAARIGLNYTLLAQYIQGKKTPSEKQIEKIVAGLHAVGKDMTRVDLI